MVFSLVTYISSLPSFLLFLTVCVQFIHAHSWRTEWSVTFEIYGNQCCNWFFQYYHLYSPYLLTLGFIIFSVCNSMYTNCFRLYVLSLYMLFVSIQSDVYCILFCFIVFCLCFLWSFDDKRCCIVYSATVLTVKCKHFFFVHLLF